MIENAHNPLNPLPKSAVSSQVRQNFDPHALPAKCWRFYQFQVGGAWSPFLAEAFQRLKLQWGYAVPPTPEEQAQLTALCQQTLAFENHFLALAREFLLERISSPTESTRAWAAQEIQKLAG